MTEQEWLTGCSYRHMYDMIRGQATTRRVRLYMVACCRLVTAEWPDHRVNAAVTAAESCADDLQAEAILNAIWHEFVTSPHPLPPKFGPEGEFARVITGVSDLLNGWSGVEHYEDAHHAIAHVAYLCLREAPGTVFTGGEGDAAEYCGRAIEGAISLHPGALLSHVEPDTSEEGNESMRAMAHLLRDIFGNPFRPVTFAPAWRTSTALALARQMYDSRDFSGMPILADALQDAGCDNPDILNHCRSDGPHCRGCWAVDLLTGRT